jgi:esterase/lipase
LAAGSSDAADRVVAVFLLVLRAVTLALGAAVVIGSSGFVHPLAARAALGVLAAESVALWVVAARRWRRRASPTLYERTALVETVVGVAGLVVVAYATPLELRTTSTFWIEPYTVISAVVLAAAARRAIVGCAGAACLTATYLLCVFVFAHDGMKLSAEAQATAWTNALSYLPFFAVAAIGFALVRTVVGNIDALRSELEYTSARLARMRAAGEAYDIGHDIAKAALRELRGAMTPQMRSRAQKHRVDLMREMSREERRANSLRDELNALAVASAAAMTGLEELDVIPAGAPTDLIVRAVRELLNNASEYARGFPVTLTARSSIELVQVTVHDDGPGVDPAILASSWARKQGTLHQLQAAGGRYRVDSSPDARAGTAVTVTWPAVVPDRYRAGVPLARARWGRHLAGRMRATTPEEHDARRGQRAQPGYLQRASRRRRQAAIALVSILMALLFAVFGVAWYASGRLMAITHVRASYPLRVVASDTQNGIVVLRRGTDAAEPGTFRLAWPGGHAIVGAVISSTSETVTRRISVVDGQLKVGQRVGIEPDRYTGDPLTALDLDFSTVGIPTALGPMPAWYIPGRRSTWMILIHGLGGSRADTLPAMPTLHALGYPMLAVSYRSDVDAPHASDHRSHLGATEWHDVAAAVDYAVGHHASGAVLYGYSLGGSMALIVARDPHTRPYVRAVVLDSPLLDWPATLDYAAERQGIPQVLASITETLLAWRAHIDYAQFDQLEHERQLRAPVLLFQGSKDTVVPPNLARQFAHDRPALITYVPVTGADHVSAIDTDPSAYKSALRRFLAARP